MGKRKKIAERVTTLMDKPEMIRNIGIVAHMAFIPERDKHIRMIEAGHLFQPSTTRIAIRNPSPCLPATTPRSRRRRRPRR